MRIIKKPSELGKCVFAYIIAMPMILVSNTIAVGVSSNQFSKFSSYMVFYINIGIDSNEQIMVTQIIHNETV